MLVQANWRKNVSMKVHISRVTYCYGREHACYLACQKKKVMIVAHSKGSSCGIVSALRLVDHLEIFLPTNLLLQKKKNGSVLGPEGRLNN